MRENYPFLIMVLPAVIVVFLFNYLPIYGVLIAFQDFMPGDKIFADTTIWVGFHNFKRFFTDVQFWDLMKNTFLLCIEGFLIGFSSFNIWADGSVIKPSRVDTATTLTMTSQNVHTDWWKIKLEKDIAGQAGQCYEVTYTFTSDAAGRIKFVNDDATYFASNEYDVVVGQNTFKVQFKFGGKPYSCLELGSLGPCSIVFENYTIEGIEEPEVTTNGFESYKAWTEASMKPLTREDDETSMTIISENAAGDWWKVKLETNFALKPGKTYEAKFVFTSDAAGDWWKVKVENNFATEAGKTYKATYTFTSNAEGDIKFGGDNMTCHTADVYHVVAGENTFTVTFTVSASNAYNCLELGSLGAFEVTFIGASLQEVV